MKNEKRSERVNIDKLDSKTIERLSSELTRMLSEAAKEDPDTSARFHLKIPHIRAGFSRTGHFEVIVGNPEPDGDPAPDEPTPR